MDIRSPDALIASEEGRALIEAAVAKAMKEYVIGRDPEPKTSALSVRNFCQRLSISPSTFWKHVRAGDIRVVRIGGRTLVPYAELARILDETEAA